MKDYIRKIKSKDISSKIKTFNENHSFDEINEYMKNKRYDLVGIENSDGVIDSYIKKNENKTHFIKMEDIISSEMPLIEVFLKFIKTNKKRFFIIRDDKINEILTESDLLKQPSRMLLFNIISSFEYKLTEDLKYYDNSNLEGKVILLAEKQMKKDVNNNFTRSYKRYLRLKKKNREISIFDNLYLIKKMELSKKYKLINISDYHIEKINELRNSIVHGDDYIDESKKDLYDMIKIIIKHLE